MNGRTNSSDVTIQEINYGALIPLEAPTDLQLTPLDKKATIRWQDPVDKYADPGGELASQWAYSIVIRKESSAPTSPDDGVFVLKTTTRNQYSSDVYTDDGNLDNTKLYYYAVYAYNAYDVPSEPVVASVQPRDAILEFNQTLSDGLRNASGYLTSASVNDTYALFAGGRTFHSTSTGDRYTNAVDAFDSSLTRTTATSLYASCCGAIGVSTPQYAFFAGGYGGNIYRSARAYDSSLTTHNISLSCLYASSDGIHTSVFDEIQKCGSSLNEYAIFQGMRSGSTFQTVDSSLTVSTLSTSNFLGDYDTFGCEYADGAIFIKADTVLKITPTMTTEVINVPGVDMGYHGAGLCRCGDYIVGQQPSRNITSALGDKEYQTKWQSINRWLTISNIYTDNRFVYTASSTIGTYAVFATSFYNNDSGGGGLDGGGEPVISYNHSLTRTTHTDLNRGRHHGAITTIGDNLIVAGGSREYYNYGQNFDFYNIVDVYTIK